MSGEEARGSALDEATRVLVGVSHAVAAGDQASLEAALTTAAREADPVRVEEVLLQSYLFLGYPAALRGLAAWREISGRAAPQVETREPMEEWEPRGERTCSVVYGEQYGRLRANVARLHPELDRWMVVEGYGKVLGRPQLDLVTRELCIIALLAAQDAAPQLYSHLRGALRAGADPAVVGDLVTWLAERLAAGRVRTLNAQWDAVRGRAGEQGVNDVR